MAEVNILVNAFISSISEPAGKQITNTQGIPTSFRFYKDKISGNNEILTPVTLTVDGDKDLTLIAGHNSSIVLDLTERLLNPNTEDSNVYTYYSYFSHWEFPSNLGETSIGSCGNHVLTLKAPIQNNTIVIMGVDLRLDLIFGQSNSIRIESNADISGIEFKSFDGRPPRNVQSPVTLTQIITCAEYEVHVPSQSLSGSGFLRWEQDGKPVSENNTFRFRFGIGKTTLKAVYETVASEDPPEDNDPPVEDPTDNNEISASCTNDATSIANNEEFRISFNVIQQGINNQYNLSMSEIGNGIYKGSFKIETSDGIYNADGLSAIIVNIPDPCHQLNDYICETDNTDTYNPLEIAKIMDFYIKYKNIFPNINTQEIINLYKRGPQMKTTKSDQIREIYNKDNPLFVFGDPDFFNKSRDF